VRIEDITLAFEELYPLAPASDIAEEAKEDRTTLTVPIALVNGYPDAVTYQARPLSIQPAKTTLPGAVGFEAFAVTHLNSDGNPFYGIEAGIGVVVRTEKRMRLHAGASYSYYNIDGLGLFGTGSNADEELLGNNQGGQNPGTGVLFDLNDVYANNLEFSEARQLTEKFHYLQVPVSLEYRISPRISAAAGVRAAVLISAPARYRLNDSRFSASPLTSGS
jgi:hypothetical protein